MAASDYYLLYRGMTDQQLVAEDARLAALDSGFASMGMGSKSFAFAIGQNNDKRNAVAFVRRERGYTVPDCRPGAPNTQVFVTDFSDMR